MLIWRYSNILDLGCDVICDVVCDTGGAVVLGAFDTGIYKIILKGFEMVHMKISTRDVNFLKYIMKQNVEQ